MQFPLVSGSNLLRQKRTLPADLDGSLNILFIPFLQWQQMEVDSWIAYSKELEQAYPAVRYYELPTIQRMNMLSQTFINEGMRAGIPNRLTRERTITLYLNKSNFRRALDIRSEESITVLLVSRQGDVLWRAEGSFTPEKGAELLQCIQRELAENVL